MKEFTGKTIDDAIEAGLKALNLARRDVMIEVLAEPRKGFLGFGQREARVGLTPKETLQAEEAEAQATPAVDSELEASSTSEAEASILEEPVSADQETEEAWQELSAADNEMVEPAIPAEEEKAEEPLEPAKAAPTSMDEDPQTFAVTTKADDTEDEEETAEVQTEDGADEEVAEPFDVDFPARYVIDVCRAYGVGEVTVEVEDLGKHVIYHIETDKPGLVIGKHGKILNALENLVRVLTHRYVRNRVQVTLNVGDYRERRLATLQKLAEGKAQEALDRGGSVQLNPLPARERKIVHQVLAQYDHIETYSKGREPRRYLVIQARD